MKVLVTGSAGYIGSVITAALAGAGHEPVTYDRQHGQDIRNRMALEEALEGAEAVIHCAARTLVTESLADPDAYWKTNFGGTLTLLEAMRKAGVTRIVHSSTAAVYGEPEHGDIAEDHPVRPVTPYGASKLAADMLLAEYARLHGFAAVSFRYFNVAGAYWRRGKWRRGKWIGERHDPETHLIPNVLAAARAGTRVKVCGDDYPTPDGTCVRDYIHVTDLADAHLLALVMLDAGGYGEHGVYNLGTSAGFTVREVIALCREVTGRDIREETAARRPGDPARLVASAARARAELGWKPSRDLRAIVEDAWAFMQQEHQERTS